jgi:hypothetical protein
LKTYITNQPVARFCCIAGVEMNMIDLHQEYR